MERVRKNKEYQFYTMRKYNVQINGKQIPVRVIQQSPEEVTLSVDQTEYTVSFDLVSSALPGSDSGDTAQTVSGSKDGTVKSPMPGLVIEVPVSIGDTVNTGDAVIVVEAMKMQNALTAPISGTIEEIFVQEGERVEKNVDLVRIVP